MLSIFLLKLEPSVRVVHAATAVTNVSVSFSPDASQVVIAYGLYRWTFPRPVVPNQPWMTSATNPYGGRLYWIAPTGNDSSDGSQGAPLRTIQVGVDRAKAGDIVYINAGTYYETVKMNVAGQSGKPIVLSAAPGALGLVRLVSPPNLAFSANPNTERPAMVKGYRANLWVNGLVIEGYKAKAGSPANDDYNANGISGAETGLVTATNNVIYNNLHCGIKGSVISSGNIIFENGTDTLDHGIYMPLDDLQATGNIIFHNAGWGIHMYQYPRRNVITRNIVFENSFGGIVVGGSYNKIYQNVVVKNVTVGILYYRDGATNNDVKNNIFAFNGANAKRDGNPSNNSDDYNTYFSLAGSDYAPSGVDFNLPTGPHEIIQDPRFQNAIIGDYRLQPSSPSIDRGINLGMPFVANAPDMGAYESTFTAQTTSTVTSSPTRTPVNTAVAAVVSPVKSSTPIPTATTNQVKPLAAVPTTAKTATPLPTATTVQVKTSTPVPTTAKTATPLPTATKTQVKTSTPAPTTRKTSTPVRRATKIPPTATYKPSATPLPTIIPVPKFWWNWWRHWLSGA